MIKIKLFIGLLTIFISVACNPTRVVKPLNKGQLQGGVSLGGPAITMGSLPVLLPLTSVHAAYGYSNITSIFGSIQTTSLLFGVLHTDIGVTQHIKKQNGYVPAISTSAIANLMIDWWEWRPSILPQIDLNFYWQYKQKPHLIYTGLQNWFEPRTTRAHGEKQPENWLPSLSLGHQWVKQKYNWQLEARYIGFTQSNKNIVVDYISPGNNGALGIYFGVQRKF
jgi:hypothetical protein